MLVSAVERNGEEVAVAGGVLPYRCTNGADLDLIYRHFRILLFGQKVSIEGLNSTKRVAGRCGGVNRREINIFRRRVLAGVLPRLHQSPRRERMVYERENYGSEQSEKPPGMWRQAGRVRRQENANSDR
jgi:hypothetical protein